MNNALKDFHVCAERIPSFATMQQANIEVISLRSCKHYQYDSLKSHIRPIGLGATFVIIVY